MTSARVLAANVLVAAASFAAAIPTGPAVGQKAFDFDLKDQKGVSRNLASVLGPKGALLVFYRSCDW
jgi:hypothetical protein